MLLCPNKATICDSPSWQIRSFFVCPAPDERMSIGPTDAEERVETPRQIALRVGLSEGKIRQLIRAGRLEPVWIGSRVFIPSGAWGRFIAESKGRLCRDETKDPGCVGSQS